MSLKEFENLHTNSVDYHVLGLNCLSLRDDELNSLEIRAYKSPLVIEYTSSQRLHLKAKLFDTDGNKIKNATLIQSDFSKQPQFKYCVIADIPEKNKTFLLVLYGVNKDPKSIYPELSKYLVCLDQDEIINEDIPQYNLSFDYHIKLKSHFSQLIKFETNPLFMEFIVPNYTQAQFKVTKKDDTPIENAVFAQKVPENSSMQVYVALPKINEAYFLKLYAKPAKDAVNKNFNYVSQFQLVRTHSDENDNVKYCTIFATDFKFFIFSPTKLFLNSNQSFDFKYWVKDATKVALEFEKKWFNLEKTEDQSEPNIWILKKSFSSKGKVTLYAQFDDKKGYCGVCSYEVVA